MRRSNAFFFSSTFCKLSTMFPHSSTVIQCVSVAIDSQFFVFVMITIFCSILLIRMKRDWFRKMWLLNHNALLIRFDSPIAFYLYTLKLFLSYPFSNSLPDQLIAKQTVIENIQNDSAYKLHFSPPSFHHIIKITKQFNAICKPKSCQTFYMIL